MKMLLYILFLLPFFVLAQPAQVAKLTSEAKALEQQLDEEGALQRYLEVLKLDPNNFDATWNTSFLYAKIGNRQIDIPTKSKYFNTAKDYAAKALQLNPKNADANYAMAVALGRMALIAPPKEKVAASRDMKKYAELAIQYNPAHSGAFHVLGLWNYEVASLNFAERSAAKYLFGGVPSGSMDEAIMNYVQAIKLAPGYILYYLDLAKALAAKNNKDQAIRTLQKAQTLPIKTEDDPAYLTQCKTLLDQLK